MTKPSNFELALTTSAPTATEATLNEMFEPLSSDQTERLAGVVIRACVNMARYRRSTGEQYPRLIRAAQTYAVVTVTEAWREDPAIAKGLSVLLEKVTSEEFPVAQIVSNVSFDGTEGPRLAFDKSTDPNSTSLPA